MKTNLDKALKKRFLNKKIMVLEKEKEKAKQLVVGEMLEIELQDFNAEIDWIKEQIKELV